MSHPQNPKMNVAEVNAVLCRSGTLHELENRLIDGRVLRVYKNLYPSLRTFWLWAVNTHKNKTYIVFESERYTYQEAFQLSLKWAAIFRDVYGICKGDRVALCSVNSSQYIVAFWACHLLGAVSVLVNSMLSLDPLLHCLKIADCKLVLLDSKRADLLEPVISSIGSRFAVLRGKEGKGKWKSMDVWDSVLQHYRGDPQKILTEDPRIQPEDDASIVYTSGTTGLPKGVLSTQRMFLSCLPNSLTMTMRAMIRQGQDPYASLPAADEVQKGILLPTPLFHVTGTAVMLLATFSSTKLILMRRWNVDEATRVIKGENVRTIVGVSSLAFDLAGSVLSGWEFENIIYGGAPVHQPMVDKATEAFPKADMSQSYGLTETNAAIAGFRGQEFIGHIKSVGPPMPAIECKIMNRQTNVEMPAGQVGEIWLRGPSVMKCYWRDPEATKKALTKDGWFMTGDLGHKDSEGYLYITDRAKDIIIRGGENIDSVSVENALYAADSGVAEAVVVGVPDDRLGELVAALVTLRPSAQISDQELLRRISNTLPKFAVPVMLLIQKTPFIRTPSGKIVKTNLKKIATQEWARRSSPPKL